MWKWEAEGGQKELARELFISLKQKEIKLFKMNLNGVKGGGAVRNGGREKANLFTKKKQH